MHKTDFIRKLNVNLNYAFIKTLFSPILSDFAFNYSLSFVLIVLFTFVFNVRIHNALLIGALNLIGESVLISGPGE